MDHEMLKALQGLTIPVWHGTQPSAARALGIKSRNAAFKAAAEGVIPVISLGRMKRAPCAPLRRLLGLDQQAA